MAEGTRSIGPARRGLRQGVALALPTFALGLLLSWGALAGAGRGDFAVLLAILALPILAPRWACGASAVEPALRAAIGLAAALILALTVLRAPNPDAAILTVPLFLLLTGGAITILHLTLAPRPALGALLVALAALAGLGLARGAGAGAALGATLRTPTPWAILALIAVGVGALARFERRALALAAYALAMGGIAAFWRWGGPLADLAAIGADLAPLEGRAAGLIPAFVLIGGAAQLLLALLLPRAPWRAALRADLTAHLPLLGLPIVAATLPARRRLPFEDDHRVAWLALFLVALLILRLAVAFRLLLAAAREADDAATIRAPGWRGREARLALAFFVACCAAYWSATLWRAADFGLVGDEPQYLAATMRLWQGGDLQLADSIYSPEMTAVLAYPGDPRNLHHYEDASADRMRFSRNFGPPRANLFLPLVAAPGLTSAIELFNPNLESSGGEIVFRDAGGAVVEARAVLVEPGRSLVVRPPTTDAGTLSATIGVGKPIGVAARLLAGGNTETYFGGVVTPRHCLPLGLDPARWGAEVLVQNGLPTGADGTWTRYGADGATLAQGRFSIPPDGSATIPVSLGATPGALCLAADGPVAAALVGRASPGLIVQGSNPAQEARIDVARRFNAFGFGGMRRVLVHNPADEPVTIVLDREDGPRGAEIEIVTHGTWSLDIASGWATIAARGPIGYSAIETIGVHTAVVTPEQSASQELIIPVFDGAGGGYAISQLELTNRGGGDTQANATLLDGAGRTLWRDKLWVPVGTTASFPFWYKGTDARYIAITSREPLTATLLQREIRTARPSHGLGLSLALLPGYALAGYGGVLATVAGLAATLALALYALLRRVGLDARAAVAVGGLVALSSPLSPAAVRLYAEVGGTTLLVLALLCADNWRVGRWSAFVAAPLGLLALGGVILFHGRLLPLALVVAGATGLLVALRLFRRIGGPPARRWLVVGGVALGGVAVLAVGVAVAARIEPRLRPDYLRDYLLVARFGPRSLGILLDRASGLFPAAPVLLLAGGGFVPAIRRAPFLGWTALALCVVQFFAVALRGGGWETWGPPGRYIYPIVPFLALALGAAWCWGFARPVRVLAVILGGFGLLVTAFSWWLPLGLHYGVAVPSGYWFADVVLPPLLGANPFRLFPTLTSLGGATLGDILPWLGLLALGILLGLPWGRWWREDAGRGDAPVL